MTYHCSQRGGQGEETHENGETSREATAESFTVQGTKGVWEEAVLPEPMKDSPQTSTVATGGEMQTSPNPGPDLVEGSRETLLPCDVCHSLEENQQGTGESLGEDPHGAWSRAH